MDQHTVRNDKGQIDIAASANNYAKALSLWISQNEMDQSKIEAAINTVIDRHPKNLLMPMLVQQAMSELNPSPEQFTNTQKQVKAFIKGMKDNGKITVKRGPNAGVSRVVENNNSEETAEETEKETEEQKTGT